MTRSEIPDVTGADIADTAGRKTTRRSAQAIASKNIPKLLTEIIKKLPQHKYPIKFSNINYNIKKYPLKT